MARFHALDLLVKDRLKNWPQRPPGLARRGQGQDAWLRGRPTADDEANNPFLKLPGSNRLRTLPDGLWLNFGGSPLEGFVDIFAIEACSSLSNLLDKRSRFAPSTQSMLAVCPVRWLLGQVSTLDRTPRWLATGLLSDEPCAPLILPVRDIRVLYGLKQPHYQGFVNNQIPHPHEYFVPMEALTAEHGERDPALQALVSRANAFANFFTPHRRTA